MQHWARHLLLPGCPNIWPASDRHPPPSLPPHQPLWSGPRFSLRQPVLPPPPSQDLCFRPIKYGVGSIWHLCRPPCVCGWGAGGACSLPQLGPLPGGRGLLAGGHPGINATLSLNKGQGEGFCSRIWLDRQKTACPDSKHCVWKWVKTSLR